MAIADEKSNQIVIKMSVIRMRYYYMTYYDYIIIIIIIMVLQCISYGSDAVSVFLHTLNLTDTTAHLATFKGTTLI